MFPLRTAAALAALWLWTAPALAQEISYVGNQRVFIPDRESLPPDVLARWEVIGLGSTEERARLDALVRARDVLDAFLKSRDSSARWTPTPAYIQSRLVHGPARRLPELDQQVVIADEAATVQYVAVPVSVTTADLEEFGRHERDLRSQERLFLLGKAVAFVLCGLSLILAYLYVEERVRRCQARYIGMGVVAALVAVGAAMLLLGV